MKKILYFLIPLFPFQIFAQTSLLKGLLVDKTNQNPLEFSSVSVYQQPDSLLVYGTITDKNGKFLIKNLKQGSYYLKVQFLGYDTKIVSNINLINGQKLDVGKIEINPSIKFLNEIRVTGQQSQSLNKIDKQVYKADQFAAAKGGSAIDVLKNLPSVSVNGQGEISVRGTSGFLVLINGKPVLSDAQTLLSQLPANSLENIELITAPSAKYDADGKAGIINIVTKKGEDEGVTFTANAQYGLPSTTDYNNLKQPIRFGGDALFNFRENKWDISLGGNYTRNDVNGSREGDAYVINQNNNTITLFPSDGERSFNKNNYGGRANITYNLDKKNIFSAGFFASKKFQDRLAALNYRNTTSNLTTNAILKRNPYYNNNLETKQGKFAIGNLDYVHTFENKYSLSASFLYENDNLYGNAKNLNLTNDSPSATLIQSVYNPYTKPLEGYRFKLDHSINLGKGKLESGYQFRYDTQNGNYGYQVIPAISQPDFMRFSGSAKNENTINAFYTQYSAKAKKLEYVGGLRYENAYRTVDLVYGNAVQPFHHLSLSNLFPSINLLYSLNDGLKLKAAYARRIQRTSNNELNPIPEREHSESLEQGDPDVLPEFVNLSEFGLIKNFSKGSAFATLYSQQVKNPIQRVNSVYADSILNRLFTNAGTSYSLGLELGTNLQVNKWWNLYFGGNVYHYKIKGDVTILGVTKSIDNQSWVYSINTNNNFQLDKTWSVQANVNFLSNRATAQGNDSRFLSPNLSVKKNLMGGRFFATLQWQNIDLGMKESNRQRITTSGSDFYTSTNYIYESDVLMLNLGFNLNKLTRKLKLPGSEFGEKEF